MDLERGRKRFPDSEPGGDIVYLIELLPPLQPLRLSLSLGKDKFIGIICKNNSPLGRAKLLGRLPDSYPLD